MPQNKYNFDSVTPDGGPRKPIREGIAVGTIRTRLRDFVKRRCECGKIVYDELECMYCGKDLSSVEPM